MAGCEILHDPSSVHLPPTDAWKVNPLTIKKFYAPTDDRGFVLPEPTIEMVQSFFHDDYEWPVDSHDPRFTPDLHHFQYDEADYQPEQFDGNTIPRSFRELATRKGILPRQFHNTLHFLTYKPLMPNMEHMDAHVRAFYLARRLFTAANGLMKAQHSFEQRKKDRQLQGKTEDELLVGHLILLEQFKAHFNGYQEILDIIKEMPRDEEILPNLEVIVSKKMPRHTIKHLGHIARQSGVSKKVVTLKAKNFVPAITKIAA